MSVSEEKSEISIARGKRRGATASGGCCFQFGARTALSVVEGRPLHLLGRTDRKRKSGGGCSALVLEGLSAVLVVTGRSDGQIEIVSTLDSSDANTHCLTIYSMHSDGGWTC